MTVIDSVSLYFCAGSSDKEYHVQIKDAGTGHIVTFQYGRRGSTLRPGTKTDGPVDPKDARKIFDKIVAKQLKEGYTPRENGTPFTSTENAGRISGHLPQLLNPIEPSELQTYVNDPHYGLMEKHDGERRMLLRAGNIVEGVNRKGLLLPVPQALADVALALTCSGDGFLIDGEIVGEKLFAFDLLEIGGKDLRDLAFADRFSALGTLFRENKHVPGVGTTLILSRLYIGAAKQAAIEKGEAENWEGFVFKDMHAPYRPGRPNSGGTQVKHKRYATCTVEVARVNAQRSVAMRLYDRDGAAHNVGNVTIPANHTVPAVGALIEVRYLYAYRNGSIYQPTYLGERSDLDVADCVLDQLQYKREPAA